MNGLSSTPPRLEVANLSVTLRTRAGHAIRPVRDVSFDLHPGRTLGVVGESGSGKSSLALAISKLHSPLVDAAFSGSVSFGGRNLLTLSESKLRAIRGASIGYVFQSPEAALDPTRRVGSQIVQVIRAHRKAESATAQREAVDLLERVGIESPSRAARRFPHELSGGMRQRVVVAMAVANRPAVLIADEPTSSVDVLVQDRILALLAQLRDDIGMAMVFISHDLRVVSRVSDEVMVMYGGRMAEIGPTDAVLRSPRHWYTVGLLRSLPDPRHHYGPDHRFLAIDGAPISPEVNPTGCPFAERCDHAGPVCYETFPDVAEASEGNRYACWFPSAEPRGRTANAHRTSRDD